MRVKKLSSAGKLPFKRGFKLGWFYKAAKYITKSPNAAAAFVSTNSITQGAHLQKFWNYVFDFNVRISFAYTTFKWSNNAKNNAGVSVVVIGLQHTSSKNIKYIISDGLKIEMDVINPSLSIKSVSTTVLSILMRMEV